MKQTWHAIAGQVQTYEQSVKTAFSALYMTAFGCHPVFPQLLALQGLQCLADQSSAQLRPQVLGYHPPLDENSSQLFGYHQPLAESSLVAPAPTELLLLMIVVPAAGLQLLEGVAAANISPASHHHAQPSRTAMQLPCWSLF